MRSCPACGELGLFAHSVVVGFDALRAAFDGGPEAAVCSECTRCGAAFRRSGPEALAPMPRAELEGLGRTLWIVPPWVEPSEVASFELSWDVTESFFERHAAERPLVLPLRRLLTELRAAGFGERLRAGQSLDALGLSRARKHGLSPEHSHLFLHPEADGRLRVEGTIGGRTIALGPIDAVLDGPLAAEIESLAALPIE